MGIFSIFGGNSEPFDPDYEDDKKRHDVSSDMLSQIDQWRAEHPDFDPATTPENIRYSVTEIVIEDEPRRKFWLF